MRWDDESLDAVVDAALVAPNPHEEHAEAWLRFVLRQCVLFGFALGCGPKAVNTARLDTRD